jgi:hypothetical protein
VSPSSTTTPIFLYAGLAGHHVGWFGVSTLGLVYSCTAILVRLAAWAPAPARA